MKFKKNLLKVLLALLIITLHSCKEEEPTEPANTAPQISDQSFSVNEDVETGTLIGTISATDPEEDSLSFSIQSGNLEDVFLIDEKSGEISLQGLLDFEVIPSYELVVEVSDGDLSSSSTVVIELIDVEELTNEFSIDGVTYSLIDGLIEDYGNYNPLENDDTDLLTHVNYDFLLFDDELELVTDEDGNSYFDGDNITVVVYAELFSPDGVNFEPGTFEYKDLEGLSKEDLAGEFFFRYLDIVINPNTETNNRFFTAISGTVVIEENSELNYNLTYDLVVQEADIDTDELIGGTEQPISFTFTGDFNFYGDSDSRSLEMTKRKKYSTGR